MNEIILIVNFPKMKSMNKKINLLVMIDLLFLTIASSISETGLINLIVETESGKVQGVANESVTVTAFKGIPYAAPPVGDLRWKEPPVEKE